MIRHICMFKIKEENKKENISEFLKRAESLREIPEIKGFEVVTNSPQTPNTNYDVALIFDFENVSTLNSYQKAPLHLEFGAFVANVNEERACIDYEF